MALAEAITGLEKREGFFEQTERDFERAEVNFEEAEVNFEHRERNFDRPEGNFDRAERGYEWAEGIDDGWEGALGQAAGNRGCREGKKRGCCGIFLEGASYEHLFFKPKNLKLWR